MVLEKMDYMTDERKKLPTRYELKKGRNEMIFDT